MQLPVCMLENMCGTNVRTCDVDLSGVIALLPVGGDKGPTVDVGGLPDVPLNTSSSFCVSCAKPCAAVTVETIIVQYRIFCYVYIYLCHVMNYLIPYGIISVCVCVHA